MAIIPDNTKTLGEMLLAMPNETLRLKGAGTSRQDWGLVFYGDMQDIISSLYAHDVLLSDDNPEDVGTAAAPGTEPTSSRADHVHLLVMADSTPQEVGAVETVGSSPKPSPQDHAHKHALMANGATDLHDSTQIEDRSTWSETSVTAALTGAKTHADDVTNPHSVTNTQLGTVLATTMLMTGFESKTAQMLSFVNGSRELTVNRVTDFSFWSNNIRYTKTASEVFEISVDEGLHYVYYDGAAMTEALVFDERMITEWALVSIIMWDATNSKQIMFGREPHTSGFGSLEHLWAHDTLGALLESGGLLGDILTDQDGSAAAHCEFSNGSTVFHDEDLDYSYGARASTANITKYYRTGADASNIWRVSEVDSFAVLTTGTGRAAYNQNNAGTWQQTETPNNDFLNTHVFVFNDTDREFGIIQGQATYATRAAAREGALVEVGNLILAGLPTPEFVFLGTIIIQTKDTYANAVKSRTVTTDGGGDYIDLRDISIGRSGSVAAHASLSGLLNNDHPQYALVSNGTPATAGATGAAGEIQWDGDYIYVCIATDTWLRAPILTW